MASARRVARSALSAPSLARRSSRQLPIFSIPRLALALFASGLARRIFTKAGLDNSSVLQATDYIISEQSKVMDSTKGLIIGSHLSSLLDNARKNKKQMGDDFVSVEHLLLAFHSDKRFGKKLFKNLKLTEKDLKGAIAAVRGNQRVTDQYPEGKYEVLDRYGNDLTELARRGKLDPVIGRDDEIQQCILILSRKTKNNPVIIGEPEVGKTAIAEGLAQWIVRGDVLEKLRNRKLISVDMCSLVADAKYHGDLEERLRAVLKEVTASNGQIILFIDDIHIVVGARASDSMDAEILLKMLGRGDLRCIGATTLNEYLKMILHLSVDLHNATVSAAVLADRYITEHFLPDKAIYLVDEAAAKLNIEMTSKPTELDEIDGVNLEMEAAECEYDLNRVVELKYGTLMSLQHQLEEVEKKLTDFQKSGLSLHRDEVTDIDIAEMRVVGQDIAIKSVVAAIRRSRIGNRPIASFMFMGPTGVGKTELAKALAGYLFNTENAQEDGQLTEVVRRRPYSVVLFDKIEKSHHDVFKILLQLLDDGKVEELARQTFRSNFFMNSIDEYIVFQPLDSKQIIEIQLKQVQDRLKQRKKIDLHYTKGAVELLGQ
ncbi:hypothetical protein QYF36_024690 [Acer negundo]|nr:hypothetical protein QYF36_024690 [Acer negundo]